MPDTPPEQSVSDPPEPPAPTAPASPEELSRYGRYLRAEWEAAALYRRLADTEPDAERAAVLRELAGMEERHAARWQSKLSLAGAPLPTWKPSLRSRALGWLARVAGTRAVVPILERAEAGDEDMYAAEPAAQDFSLDERTHARVFARLLTGHPNTARAAASQIAAREGRHRSAAGGSVRAGVFGVNDGLLSNLSLVMGVAGAASNQSTILLTGVAGLLAGAFSMATGEFISMSVQRELFEREIDVERAELESDPDEERQELALIYRAKGLSADEAERVAAQLMADRGSALDTLAREELGLDPGELGSPWGAALSSFAMFAVGAFVPVLPYLLLSGQVAFFGSIVLSSLGILLVGAVTAVLTGRSVLVGAARQLALGAAAAAVTFGAGRLLGVALRG
ncbi:MAG: VIT1/CCC1 family protein [Chloroflexota bacterium]|nr:VIT1/CCC1 family protein [Chloroflexota bacterium]